MGGYDRVSMLWTFLKAVLQRGYALAVCSNNPVGDVRATLAELQWTSAFETGGVFGRDQLKPSGRKSLVIAGHILRRPMFDGLCVIFADDVEKHCTDVRVSIPGTRIILIDGGQGMQQRHCDDILVLVPETTEIHLQTTGASPVRAQGGSSVVYTELISPDVLTVYLVGPAAVKLLAQHDLTNSCASDTHTCTSHGGQTVRLRFNLPVATDLSQCTNANDFGVDGFIFNTTAEGGTEVGTGKVGITLVDDLRIATISVHSVPASMEELVNCVRLTAVWQQFWAPWVTPLCVAVRCSLSHPVAGRKGESRVWNIDKVLVSRNSEDFWKKSSDRPIQLEPLPHRTSMAVRGKLLTFMALLATRVEPWSRTVSPPWELLCPSCTVSYPVVCLTDGEREALCNV